MNRREDEAGRRTVSVSRRSIFGVLGVAAAAAPLALAAEEAAAAPSRKGAEHSADWAGLTGQHPRLILGSRISDSELQRRAAAPAYAAFVSTLKSYCDSRADLPTITSPGTENQWQSIYWALPELTLAWRITGDESYATKVRDWTLLVTDPDSFPEWGPESGGSMANSLGLIAIAIAYDWAHDLFSEAERTVIRDKIALQADKLRDRFGSGYTGTLAYWQHDYQNNHHHMNIGGMVAASVAIYGDGASDSGQSDEARVEFAANELREALSWISPDGSQHESITYANYGNEHLIRSLDILESAGSGSLWADPEIPGMAQFKIDMSLPTLFGQAEYGDTDGSLYYFNPYLWFIASRTEDGELQDFLLRQYAAGDAGKNSFAYSGWNILWHDDELVRGDLGGRRTTSLYPDLGVLASRTSWDDDAVALLVKSGVIGGKRLNRWRDRLWTDYSYINVAHDKPDGGHFALSFGGARFGAYTPYGRGLTSYTNAIVAGQDVGQAGELSSGWLQPYTGMRDRAAIPAAAELDTDTVLVADPSGLYASPSTSKLTRVRRTIAFVDRTAAIVLDDVASSTAQNLHALFHSVGTVTDSSGGWNVSQDTASGEQRARVLLGGTASDLQTGTEDPAIASMGTTWRTTAPSAEAAQFATVVLPIADADDEEAALSVDAVEGAVQATLTRGSRADVLIAPVGATERAELTAEAAGGTGRALLVRVDGEQTVHARILDGDAVHLDDLAAQTPSAASLGLTLDGSTLTVVVTGAVPQDDAPDQITLSGLPSGERTAQIDGKSKTLTVADDGSVSVELLTGSTHRIVIALS